MNGNIRKTHKCFILVVIYLGAYGILSASFLCAYPFVHSDESWLAGLTRDMMDAGSFGVTESFFDAKPRVAHAIRILFHGLQMGYLSAFGYQIGAVRLLSLTGALACLSLVFLIGKTLKGTGFGIGLMALVSLDIQFIYASHFARQEILLCVSLGICLLLLLRSAASPSLPQSLILAGVTGLSIGLHPNSFLLAALCGFVMGIQVLAAKGKGLSSLLAYVAFTGLFALCFIGLSSWFHPHFLSDYFRLGQEEFELRSSASGRISEYYEFFKSIYNRESGTYYLPDLRLELTGFLFAGGLLLPAFFILRSSQEPEERLWCLHTRILASGLSGLFFGMLVIGRFNQLSIIFFLLMGWLLTGQLLLLFQRKGRFMMTAILLAALAYGSLLQIQKDASAPSYERYLGQLQQLIPGDQATIGNLNMGFHFDSGVLKDYRNLPYLDGFDALKQYVEENQIQYICISDELDFIYQNRPYYHVIYGNALFVKDLKDYCQLYCQPVGTIRNPQYAARIISLLQDPAYETVTVYQVR